MGWPIDMEQKGYESIRCFTYFVTLSYDLDLGFSRLILKCCISGIGVPIDMERKGCELTECWTHVVTFNFDLIHDLDLEYLLVLWISVCTASLPQLGELGQIFTRGQFWPSGIVVACVCPSVRPSTTKFVRAITHQLSKLGSPNLDQRCKRPWLRSLLFCGTIDRDLQGQIELQSQNLPHFELVHAITHHQLKLRFPNLEQKCILALFRSLPILALIKLIFNSIFNFKLRPNWAFYVHHWHS